VVTGEAPYQRIVAEIAELIRRGELRPGERVPSTRQITVRWGVAMATATKVLAALRDAGLVDTRPGSGTVVRASVAPVVDRPAHRELDRDRVVRTGIAVADREGLPMLSMRRIATELGVATMSLYRHVSGKEELVLVMADTVFGDEPFPARAPTGWRARLEVAASLMWTVFRRHPWAAEVLSLTRPQLMPNLLRYAEWSLGALRDLGLGTDDMMYAHLTLFGHVRGTALSLDAETQAQRDTGLTNDEWMDAQDASFRALIASGRYPMLRHVAQQEFDFDFDAIFTYGLRRILDGLDRTGWQ